MRKSSVGVNRSHEETEEISNETEGTLNEILITLNDLKLESSKYLLVVVLLVDELSVAQKFNESISGVKSAGWATGSSNIYI